MTIAANTIAEIIDRLTSKGEHFAPYVWVGDNYSKADLLRDLREINQKGTMT